jgi:hypothetical protein
MLAVRHKPPVTRIQRIIAVIAHHEIVPSGTLHDDAFDTVAAIFLEREIGGPDKGRALVMFSSRCGWLTQLSSNCLK